MNLYWHQKHIKGKPCVGPQPSLSSTSSFRLKEETVETVPEESCCFAFRSLCFQVESWSFRFDSRRLVAMATEAERTRKHLSEIDSGDESDRSENCYLVGSLSYWQWQVKNCQ